MHPGNFSAARKAFLLTQRPAYDAAFEIGDAKNAIANIFRRYCKRFPLSMPDDQDPSQDELEMVDDEDANDSIENVDISTLAEEEQAKAQEERAEQARKIKSLKAKIQCWLNYRYIKDHAAVTKRDVAMRDNPFANLFFILDGKPRKKPVKKSAINLWSRGHTKSIEEEAQDRVKRQGGNMARDLVGIRAAVKKEMFDELDQEDQAHYEFLSKEEHKGAVAQWTEDQASNAPSTTPEARQQCIDDLNRVVLPMLDAICAATGWTASFIAGGPEPKQGGQLSMKVLHSGTTSGETKLDWGRAEHEELPKVVYPLFAKFLKKCYTVKECQSRALLISEPRDAEAGSNSQPNAPPPLPPLSDFLTPPTTVPPSPPPLSDSLALSATVPPLPPPPANVPPPPLPAPSDPLAPPTTFPPPPISSSREPSPIAQSREPSPIAQSREPSPIAQSRKPSPIAQSREPSPIAQSREPSPIAHTQSPSPVPTEPGSPLPLPCTLSSLPDPTHAAAPVIPVHQSATPALQVQDAGSTDSGPSTRSKSAREIIEGHIASSRGVVALKRMAIESGEEVSAPAKRPRVEASISPPDRTRGSQSAAANTRIEPVKWFSDALRLFVNGNSEDSLGNGWAELLEAYSRFQGRYGYLDDRRLPKKGRPAFVDEWIRVGRTRSFNWRPRKLVLKDVEKGFQAWWVTLQPSWRVEKGVIAKDKLEGDWDSLRLPGVNGMLSVVAALYFWGLEARGTKARRDAWDVALKDCSAVLNAMIE
ncbi:hypothetical protein CVT24_006578 [Panaeolus cyanescens]|uniref:Uncharacterized protein n=1 Tax=Panaeolus cyanescens TaxID=181874 RepID=A0A409WCD7_9AGAR|nr:hypothetical protein CVT24_006578 [Panaeolus cyanescens]